MQQDICVSTEQLNVSDRLDFWREQIAQLLIHIECQDQAGPQLEVPLEAQLLHQDFGLLRMATLQGSSHAVARSQYSIRQDHRDAIFACLMLQGQGFTYQGVECVQHQAGDIVFYDTARPYGHGFPKGITMAVLDIPRALFEETIGPWRSGELVKIDHRTTLAAGTVTNAHSRLSLSPWPNATQRQYHASQMLEWLHSLWQVQHGHRLRSYSSLSSLWRAKSYIEQHLADDGLKLETISQAIGLSPRQLARIFASEGLSVGRYLWERRLARCHLDLQNPGLRHLALSEIAYRWGFNHLAHFSRSYKQYFGQVPSKNRFKLND